jgi:hypothetical protein
VRLLKLVYEGSSYGRIWTYAMPTGAEEMVIRPSHCALPQLAQLAADLLGEEQPYTRHEVGNLVRWVVRYGCSVWGEREFLRETARALIWRRVE